MTYRDSFEQCPRCHVTLVDARAARACEQCGGLWVEEPVLSEMVLTMLPPQPHGRLLLAVMQRAGDKLPCPTCGDAMHPTAIHGVELDRCPKHGIWFDKPELEMALRRVGDPTLPPPLERPAEPPPPPPAALPAVVPTLFVIATPGQNVREVRLQLSVIKLGTLKTAHVRLDDPRVSRMHAVIEIASLYNSTVIDLGSSQGTFVNGKRVTKARLHHGDELLLGATAITFLIGV